MVHEGLAAVPVYDVTIAQGEYQKYVKMAYKAEKNFPNRGTSWASQRICLRPKWRN
jgi:endonuclease YncB( thermonuclease family)